jgi:hypothetical protein
VKEGPNQGHVADHLPNGKPKDPLMMIMMMMPTTTTSDDDILELWCGHFRGALVVSPPWFL